MNEPLPVVLDGVPAASGRIPVLEVFQDGEGLFETLPLLGGRPVFLDRHLERLASGAAELGLGVPPPEALWRADLQALLGACGLEDLAVRLFLFRDGGSVHRCVAATVLPDDVDRPATVGLADALWQGARPLAHLKTLNYLVPRLAWRAGRERGLDDVLFVLADGTLLEGSRSTVFCVREGRVLTPTLDLPILPGVTRAVILEAARGAGLGVQETRLSYRELVAADEVFLTASVRGVRAVSSVDGHAIRSLDGPVTRRLRQLYAERAVPR